MRLVALLGILLALGYPPQWEMPTRAPAIVGKATYMSDGRMQEVIDYWGLPYADGVALNAKGDKDRWVYVIWLNDMTIDGPWPVVDCAQSVHYATRETQRRVLEVSADLARVHGFYGVGPVPVVVIFAPYPLVLADHIFNQNGEATDGK